MITQKTISEIFETVRIEDIISDFVNLKASGSNLKGLCPFHNEKTPSFMVSPVKNIFKCFGCGRGGNAVHFLIEHEGMSYPEALKFIAARYQIEIEETTETNRSPDEDLKRDSLYLVNQFAGEYFQKNLLHTEEGRSIGLSYFKERGFLDKSVEKFELGYAMKSASDFTAKALENSYNSETLKDLGLTTKNERDFFRERVMFPIHNLSGKIVAFGGRNLNSELKTAKYLNSPETEIYSKSLSLYGIYFAKQAIRKNDECLLVEGYTDVISLHQSGIEHVVASSGTALTDGQVRLIKRFTSNVKILFDSDPAGLKAAMRGIDIILRQDMDVQVVTLPEEEDPDSFIRKHGSQKFTDYIKEFQKDFVLFKTGLIADEAIRDPIRKTKLLKDIVSTISLIPDSLKRSVYVKECAKQLDVDEAILNEEVNRAVRFDVQQRRGETRRHEKYREYGQPKRVDRSKGRIMTSQEFSDEPIEMHIIRNLIKYGDKAFDEENNTSMAEYIIANIGDVTEQIDHPLYREIIDECATLVNTGKLIDYKIFTNHINPDIAKLAVDLLYSPDEYAGWERKGFYLQTQKLPDENYINDTHQAILRLKDRKLSKAEQEIKKRIRSLKEDSEGEKKILMKAMQKIRSQRSAILSDLGTVVPIK